MTTEILGFIIIVGAVIVLAARHQLNKAEDDPEVLEAATGRLRYELEQSADEIISRMTEHVDRLERLLREADYKAEVLQERIRQMEAMQLSGDYQPMSRRLPQDDYLFARAAAEAATVPVRTQAASAASVPPGGMAASFQTQQEAVGKQADLTAAPVSDMEQAAAVTGAMEAEGNFTDVPAMSEADRRAWDLIREASMELEAQYEAQMDTMQDVQQSDALQQAVDIQTGNLSTYVGGAASHDEEMVQEADPLPLEEAAGSMDIGVPAEQARQLLDQGHGTDEVAKMTGLGIGAVQMIQQMQSRRP